MSRSHPFLLISMLPCQVAQVNYMEYCGSCWGVGPWSIKKYCLLRCYCCRCLVGGPHLSFIAFDASLSSVKLLGSFLVRTNADTSAFIFSEIRSILSLFYLILAPRLLLSTSILSASTAAATSLKGSTPVDILLSTFLLCKHLLLLLPGQLSTGRVHLVDSILPLKQIHLFKSRKWQQVTPLALANRTPATLSGWLAGRNCQSLFIQQVLIVIPIRKRRMGQGNAGHGSSQLPPPFREFDSRASMPTAELKMLIGLRFWLQFQMVPNADCDRSEHCLSSVLIRQRVESFRMVILQGHNHQNQRPAIADHRALNNGGVNLC